MANSQLLDKQYRIPPDVLKYIQTVLVSNPNGEGVKRAKFMLKNGVVTYQVLKRLKNFFDHFDGNDKVEYAHAGGELMRSFVERTLNADRDAVSRSKETKQDMTANPNSELMPYQNPRLNEAEKDKKEEKQKNAIAVIVNNDNKILLLKRSDEDKKIWMPGKWALVGGGVEKGESPQQAVEREILEETGLIIDKFNKRFSIQRNPNSIEHIFACRYEGDPTDITLNNENTNYGWYDVDEMHFLDIVPNLIEYITLSFKKYD